MKKQIDTKISILRLSEVKSRTGLTRSSIYNFMKAGTFPNCVKLGARAVGWISRDIDAWIESRVKVVRK